MELTDSEYAAYVFECDFDLAQLAEAQRMRASFIGVPVASIPTTERFWVEFSKVTFGAYETWDMDFATLGEAIEAAEGDVDDREADEAHVTARISRVDMTYSRNDGWQ